jgi:hypothetical protein
MPRIATRLLVLFGCGIALHAQEPGVTFRGEERPLDAVAAEAPDAAAAARKWLPLVRDAGYRPVLSDDRAVLLVLSPTFVRRVPKKEHHEVEVMLGRDTLAAAKAFAPPPTGTLGRA